MKKEQDAQEDMDEAAQEEFDEKFEAANLLLHVVMDTTGLFLKLYGKDIESTIINKFGGFFYQITKNSSNEDEIHYALCFYSDLMENCSEASLHQGADEVANSCLNHWTKTTDINIQQTCVFLMGVLCRKVPRNIMQKYLENTILQTMALISMPDAYSETRAECTDNAVGTLGKICLFQLTMDNQDSVVLMNKFLSHMPLHHDSTEAKIMNRMLLEQINAKNQNLMSSDLTNSLKDILLKMNEFIRLKPELEILDTEGGNLLNQINF